MESKLLKHFKIIEKELKAVRTSVNKSLFQVFVNGMVYGGGFVLGSAFAIAVAGWALAVFGVLPGIGDVAITLYDVLEEHSGSFAETI